MLLFLDFDGVLHPCGSGTLPFEYLNDFEEVLRRYPNVFVVISSSWKESFSWEYIRDTFFSEDLAHRIIGATPEVMGGTRYEEIVAYLRQSGYAGSFLVLDDDASEFPLDWEHLFLCDGQVGLDKTRLKELAQRLSNG